MTAAVRPRFPLVLTVLALVMLGVLLMLAASLCLGHEATMGLRMLHKELDEQLAKDRLDLRND